MLLNIFIFVIGMVFMIKGADYFVKGASSIATKFKIPPIVIGLTIVAMGTSAPEASVSIGSALKGSTGVAIGNVLGSNIINILVILGLTSVICALRLEKNSVKYEIPFVVFLTVFLCVYGYYFEVLSRFFGLILLGFFVLFFVYLFKNTKIDAQNSSSNNEEKFNFPLTLLFIVGGIAALIFGSEWSVNSAINIAHTLNISERIIGLTIVALGTSLPELVTSTVAAVRKQPEIAVGNIIGSNVFNILFVLGLTCIIYPVPFDKMFVFDGLAAIISAVLLFAFTCFDRKLTRWEGILFLLLYSGYLAYLIMK